MPARFAVFVRLVLAVTSGVVVAVTPGTDGAGLAWSQDEEDEEDSGDEGDGEDTDGGGAAEEEEEEDEEGAEGEEDEDQPPVTAGGLFTKKSYPVGENLRPLTLNKGMVEIEAGFNMDLSAELAFESWRLPIEGRFGIADHVELQAGIDMLLVANEDTKNGYEATGEPLLPSLDTALFTLGLESALYYNVVDFRIALEFPLNPDAEGGDPDEATNGLDPPSPFTVDIVVGVPFRIVPRKQFAIFALDKIFTVHTISGSKPDLNVGAGFVIMPVDIVSIILRGEFTVPEFNTNRLFVPASGAVQFSPNNKFDLGLEFTFATLKPVEDDPETEVMEVEIGPFERRFLLLYVQARF